jgi:hypothetical protein
MATSSRTIQSRRKSDSGLRDRRRRDLASCVLPWPASLPPKPQPPGDNFPLPHSTATPPPPICDRCRHRPPTTRRRRQCDSIGRAPTVFPMLSWPWCSVSGHRRCSPLVIAIPPTAISFVVAERGELSCTVLPGGKSVWATIAAGPYGGIELPHP